MVNIIKRYVPSFVSGVEDSEYGFNSLEELKSIPFVKSSLNKGSVLFMDDKYLMVTYTDNKNYVLGTIKNPEDAILKAL